MSDERDSTEWNRIDRREALLWLLGVPIHLGLLAASVGAQLARPRNVRIVQAATPSADSPVARNLHPRTFVTPATLMALRAKIESDSAFKARWQTAVTQFESGTGTKWTVNPVIDPYALAFAAFIVCVRSDGDHGLTFATSRQAMLDKILTGVYGAAVIKTGGTPPHAVGLALTYDFLYHDLSSTQRIDFEGWITSGASHRSIGWASQTSHWDGAASSEHCGKFFSTIVLPNVGANFATAYDETISWAQSYDWLFCGQGLGYEWSDDTPRASGLIACLYALQNAGGYTPAQTTDVMLSYMRDAWQLVRRFVIPHPSVATNAQRNYADRVHQQEPQAYKNLGLNVGALMLWALALLPGKVPLSGAGLSNQSSLANDDADFLAFLAYEWRRPVPGAPTRSMQLVKDMNGVSVGSPLPTRGGLFTFWSFPAWLILNGQEPAAKAPSAAGIPTVRRFSPGTLDWTVYRNDLATVDTTGTSITYHHRRYLIENYATGVHQNGSWHVHRAGPLLIQRGAASHGPVSRKCTWGANGTVTFRDETEWPAMMLVNLDEADEGGVRGAGGSRQTKTLVLADPLTDYGQITNWYADDKVVALSSNLKRSYNCDEVQFGTPVGNQRKISAFTREFVVVQRGADGTDHERIFTYDRITLLDTKFRPYYNLCPGPPPIVDGVETPFTWPGTSDRSLTANGKYPWQARGPNRWDYVGATCMTVDNVTEPQDSIPGNGKVRVTWLQPNGGGAVVHKRGGTNAHSLDDPLAEGAPYYNQYGAWMGLDGEWYKVKSPNIRAYAGLYTVTISPNPVTLDTRFLMAADVMAASASPDVAANLTSDANNVAARCGASVVVFSREAGARGAGSVTIPDGVRLVVLANLPAGQTRSVAATGGLTITTSNRTASNSGALTVGVSGSGNLQFT